MLLLALAQLNLHTSQREGPPTRRVLLRAAMALPALGLSGLASARDTPMREALDLRLASADQSAAKSLDRLPQRPLVLLLSVRGCPFCEFVRRSYLLPMNREGQTNAWQVSIDRAGELRDFAGQITSPRAWAQARGSRTTPTLLFLSAEGKALAEPLIGVVSSEFYGVMLEERLATAARAIN